MNVKLAIAATVVAALFGGLLGLFFYAALGNSTNTATITCVTKGATLLQKSTKDGKYVTLWCIKGGKVVP